MKKPGRYLAGVFVLGAVVFVAAVSVASPLNPFASQQVVKNGWHLNDGVVTTDGTFVVWGCNSIQYGITNFAKAVLPVDLSDPAYVMHSNVYAIHDAVMDDSGVIWATDVSTRSVRAFTYTPGTPPVLTPTGAAVAAVPGAVHDGIAYDHVRNDLYVHVWQNGLYKIELPSMAVTLVYSMPGCRGDHLSVDIDANYVFGVGWDCPVAYQYSIQNGTTCNMVGAGSKVYQYGNALDGTACLVPKPVGGGITQPPWAAKYVFFNHMSSQCFMWEIPNYNGTNICSVADADIIDITRDWVRPMQGGEGVAAPGDWFIYTFNHNSTEIWRFRDPGRANEPEFMPLKPGSSLQSNLLCAMYASEKSGCIQPLGLMRSLISRMYDVLDLMNAGRYGEAKKRLRSEVLMGLQGISRNHVSCPELLDTILKCAETLLSKMPG